MHEKLAQGSEFFKGSRILLDFRDRFVENDEVAKLDEELQEKYGVKEAVIYNPFEKENCSLSSQKDSK